MHYLILVKVAFISVRLYLVSPECWEKMKMNANMHFFPQM